MLGTIKSSVVLANAHSSAIKVTAYAYAYTYTHTYRSISRAQCGSALTLCMRQIAGNCNACPKPQMGEHSGRSSTCSTPELLQNFTAAVCLDIADSL